ncbi:GspH/FimT family pseudopilin [Hahella ganghwensis]|uniref:GspH/FimT family pseudopilin n=1 Tax=Hahella ganghwensis TaxID=286420 RepID=UPI0003A2693E|nr:GspH/FimT family pseudopilin [Hahella ganghwensis]
MKSNGFTLVELLAVMAIFGIVVGWGAPQLFSLIEKYRADTTIRSLHQFIYAARLQAINSGTLTYICPTEDLENCNSDWSNPLMVFSDFNHNRKVDTNQSEKVSRILNPLKDGETLTIRASANKKYLVFNSRGYTNGVFGNITYCRDNDLHSARRITIRLGGRLRINRDDDQDGIVDSGSSMPVEC